MMDLVSRERSRIIWQYRNAPKALAYFDTVPLLLEQNILEPADVIANILDVDNQVGECLNIAGRIVGQTRPYVNYEILGLFGWEGNENREQWGAPWIPRGYASKGNILMPDEYYRILIKARVAKNTSDATIDSIIDATEIITSTPVSTLVDNQDMSFSIIFSDRLPIASRIMLQEFDILPRPQGVKFAGYSDPEGGVYFGYNGDPNARNYGVAPYVGDI